MKPTVAVIGANSDRRKYANKAVRAFLQVGYEVFPVHPMETTVEGQQVYKSVKDVPREKLDCVTVYLPPAVGVKVLDEIAAKPVGMVYLNPGADAPEVVAKARQLGLNAVTACSILAVGVRPDQFPDE
jgi:predicted CoA-binding protein